MDRLAAEDLSKYVADLDLGDGVHVLAATISEGGTNPLLRVVVDTAQGVTAGEIAHIARRLRDEEALGGIIGVPAYRVEVTSPGATAELKQPWQFKRHVGRKLAVQLKPLTAETENEPAVIEGTLAQTGPEALILQISPEREEIIAWETIQCATVQLAW